MTAVRRGRDRDEADRRSHPPCRAHPDAAGRTAFPYRARRLIHRVADGWQVFLRRPQEDCADDGYHGTLNDIVRWQSNTAAMAEGRSQSRNPKRQPVSYRRCFTGRKNRFLPKAPASNSTPSNCHFRCVRLLVSKRSSHRFNSTMSASASTPPFTLSRAASVSASAFSVLKPSVSRGMSSFLDT